jgi:hypothetical protein
MKAQQIERSENTQNASNFIETTTIENDDNIKIDFPSNFEKKSVPPQQINNNRRWCDCCCFNQESSSSSSCDIFYVTSSHDNDNDYVTIMSTCVCFSWCRELCNTLSECECECCECCECGECECDCDD